ncbi:MAG: hypothetical protein GEV28_03445 [Actinophytocola sp.]|uniref:hypothetical protein n=1 Tax=Actinophytocola sp. TaxID=1872138 RepID=UPI001327E25C|nr:hypothetical protein [Actinophytocola sp.]MPZ79489.1 hypothetical protein [Actinophytocola sp.]
MPPRDRVLLVVLMLDAVVLAVVELLFLPLAFDGYLLPNLDGFPLPLMPVLAAVTTPWLVSSAGKLSPRLAVAAAPLLAWIVTIAWFGMFGPGGDLLLTADWRSLLLFAGGALPSAVVLGKVLATTLGPTT